MPMAAEVSPLPRLLTTPPVMKMCLTMLCPSLTRRRSPALARHEGIVVRARVDAERDVLGLEHADPAPGFEPAQLLQVLQALQAPRREGAELRQRRRPEGVDAQVAPRAREPG